MSHCVIAPPSVTIVEGTVTNLLEEEGCVTGIQYKDKETEEIKVRRGDPLYALSIMLCFVQF